MKLITTTSMTAFLFFFSFSANAITATQCLYFESEGKTAICHATAAAKQPYVLLRVSAQACTGGHAGHESDFVAVGDTCQGSCLPTDAPCDATLGCCDGAACVNGTCERISVCAAAGDPCVDISECCEDLVCTGGTCAPHGQDMVSSEPVCK